MTDWNKIWKYEKYPMWLKNGDLATYWDKEAAKRFHRLSKSKDSSKKQVDQLNLKQTDFVLDIGCGTGRLTIPIAKRVKYVYGLDISREMLKIAKSEAEKEKLVNIEWINANFETFDVNKIKKVDVSISYNSLGVYDIKKVIEKINSITKRDVFIFTFAGRGEWLDDRLAKIIYGARITNIPSSAEIIYHLVREMGIYPDFKVVHNVWEDKFDSADQALDWLLVFYKFNSDLKEKIRAFLQDNLKFDGKKYLLQQSRDIAKIHWRVGNGK